VENLHPSYLIYDLNLLPSLVGKAIRALLMGNEGSNEKASIWKWKEEEKG
jgi:hypothetical protein